MKRLLAAVMFFTRLPLWKYVNIPSSYFSRVVEMWQVVGLLTGGVAAGVLYLASLVFSPYIAAILAVISRVLLTGALHEDGLADFFDGFGGGTTRERVLAIMKDSHIGAYGVIGLILYFILLTSLWAAVPVPMVCFLIIAGDVWSKFCAAQIVNLLPYARKAEDAKNGTVYSRIGLSSFLLALVVAMLPMMLLPGILTVAYVAPVVTVGCIIGLLKHRLGGYTGDCMGASFLLAELSFYLVAVGLWRLFL